MLVRIVIEFDESSDVEKMNYVLAAASLGGLLITTETLHLTALPFSRTATTTFNIIPRVTSGDRAVRIIVDRDEECSCEFSGINVTVSYLLKIIACRGLSAHLGDYDFIQSGDPEKTLLQMMSQY